MKSRGRGRAKQTVCVYAERQMVFYNRIFMASGKETERQTDHAIMRMFHKCVLYCAQIVFCNLLTQMSCGVRVCPLSAGVSSLISLLASAREEDQPRLNVLLCEAVMAVYLALLIHGLGTHSSNELFRLAAHPLNNRVWAAVFGGGAKVIIKPKRPEAPPGRVTIL